MPTVDVEAPTGEIYTVDAPDGVSDSDLLSFVADHHTQQTQPKMADAVVAQPGQPHYGMEHQPSQAITNLPGQQRLSEMVQHPMETLAKSAQNMTGTPEEIHNVILMKTGKPYDKALVNSYEKRQAENVKDAIGGFAGAGVIKDVGGQWITRGVEEALGKLKKVTNSGTAADNISYTPEALKDLEDIAKKHGYKELPDSAHDFPHNEMWRDALDSEHADNVDLTHGDGTYKGEKILQDPKALKEDITAWTKKHPSKSPQTAINNWIEGALRKYIINRMGTPNDEIRQLAEKDVLHVDPRQLSNTTTSHPFKLGIPKTGKSDYAKIWENAADNVLNPAKAGRFQVPDVRGVNTEDMWLQKLDPETDVHTANATGIVHSLGFDHIIDVLGEKLASGEIRPEQLNKVSVADAVRMTHDYNAAAAKRMEEARIASQANMTVHKEYPEGYKWVQLDKPGQFAQESDVMGHSVRGYEPPRTSHKELNDEDLSEITLDILGPHDDLAYKQLGEDASNLDVLKWAAINHPQEARKKEAAKLVKELESGRHPDWIPASGEHGSEYYGHGGWEAIKSGKAKVYSLRDPKGESHVTIEVGTPDPYPLSGEKMMDKLGEKGKKIWNEYRDKGEGGSGYGFHGLDDFMMNKYPEEWKKLSAGPDEITQIKGKQNRMPEDKYLPYVQDFVKSSKWGDVGDIQNTGLRIVGGDRYISTKELQDLAYKHFGKDYAEKGDHAGSNGPSTSEDPWMYYNRIKRYHDDQLSEVDLNFIKDVKNTAKKLGGGSEQ